ncbi:hypothetical protein GB881_11685, partial [Georgenia subflava]|nr:hypothetical protein [Georgenia subflava]
SSPEPVEAGAHRAALPTPGATPVPSAATPAPAPSTNGNGVPAFIGEDGRPKQQRDFEVPRVFDEEPARARRDEDLDIPDFLK